MSALIESPLYVTVHVDPSDVVSGLNGNDDAILQFVCQLVALSHSSDLREQLLARLGVNVDVHDSIEYREKHWQDEDYLPSEQA